VYSTLEVSKEIGKIGEGVWISVLFF